MTIKNFKKLAVGAGVVACVFGGSARAVTLDLTGQGYLTYGNTNSYSLPILAYQYDLANGGGTGPGNPYYVVSTPGAIQDLVVIYTGSSGTGVTTNATGFEDAYQTPSGSHPDFASTSPLTNMTAPTGTDLKGIQTVYETTWDANLAALKTFLDGGNPLFLFNNNDTNEDQNLAIWAKLWITDADGNVYNPDARNSGYLYLSNVSCATGPGTCYYGAGGFPYGNATTYDPGNVSPGLYSADVNGIKTDYVLSGGDVCINRATGIIAADQNLCTTDKANYVAINHNLGANQAAYAGDVPLLDQWLATLFGLSDTDLGKYSLHLQLNLGCDPQISAVTCDNFKIDNGYEQLFLASSKTVFENPEPGSLALLGIALAGLGSIRRRRSQR